MRVTIHGPNLRNQSKGSFRVHAEGCRDNHAEIAHNYSVGPWTIDAETCLGVVTAIYDPDEFQYDVADPAEVGSYVADVYLAPCCATKLAQDV